MLARQWWLVMYRHAQETTRKKPTKKEREDNIKKEFRSKKKTREQTNKRRKGKKKIGCQGPDLHQGLSSSHTGWESNELTSALPWRLFSREGGKTGLPASPASLFCGGKIGAGNARYERVLVPVLPLASTCQHPVM